MLSETQTNGTDTTSPRITSSQASVLIASTAKQKNLFLKEAAREVFSQFTPLRKDGTPFKNWKDLMAAHYQRTSRKRAKKRTTRKQAAPKAVVATRTVAAPKPVVDTTFKAFYDSVKGILSLPLSTAKKLEAISAIL